MTDRLATVMMLRKRAVEEARRCLAQALERLQSAQAGCEAAERAISEEMAIAYDLTAGDRAVEDFVTWLQVGEANVAKTRVARDRRQLDVDHARTSLAAARAGFEALETLIQEQVSARRAGEARLEQQVLDEFRPMRGIDG